MACVFQAVAHERGHVPGSWDVTMDAGYAEDAPSQGREQTVPHATTTSTAPLLSAANAAAFIAAVRLLFFNAPPGDPAHNPATWDPSIGPHVSGGPNDPIMQTATTSAGTDEQGGHSGFLTGTTMLRPSSTAV